MVTDSSIQLVAAAIITTTAIGHAIFPHKWQYLLASVITVPFFPRKIFKISLALTSPSVHTSKESPNLINPPSPLHFHCHSSSSQFHYLSPSFSKCLLKHLLCAGHCKKYKHV